MRLRSDIIQLIDSNDLVPDKYADTFVSRLHHCHLLLLRHNLTFSLSRPSFCHQDSFTKFASRIKAKDLILDFQVIRLLKSYDYDSFLFVIGLVYLARIDISN